jgi:hypothetical protein
MNGEEQDMTRIIERMIERQIGKPVRYDPATGEFVVSSDSDLQLTEEPKQ